ncbi:hypothetical protein APY03_3740 [Variovorax sp. WDL1]|nr:hypothetical protein APY03_3740 [Variovorax sp. WDL1]
MASHRVATWSALKDGAALRTIGASIAERMLDNMAAASSACWCTLASVIWGRISIIERVGD